MSFQSVLAPIFAEVLLVFVLLTALIVTGQRARRTPADPAERAPRERTATLVSASFSNQFEMPVLFYALVAFALITRKADGLFVALEWLYVAARFVHAAVHTTVNVIPWRGAAFAVSCLILMVAWVIFAVKILTS